jgi:hypothetical protein
MVNCYEPHQLGTCSSARHCTLVYVLARMCDEHVPPDETHFDPIRQKGDAERCLGDS